MDGSTALHLILTGPQLFAWPYLGLRIWQGVSGRITLVSRDGAPMLEVPSAFGILNLFA